jgi:hypothetical protein
MKLSFKCKWFRPIWLGIRGENGVRLETGLFAGVSVQVCFSPNFGTRVLPARSTVSHEICVEPWQQNYLSNEIGLVRFGSESNEKLPDK